MPTLSETQLLFRNAVVAKDVSEIAPFLGGGRHPVKRLAVHQRNYEVSLVKALLGKFPATVWLVGSPFFVEAARDFILQHPPAAPCIAEFGEGFPYFLSERPGAGRAPYLRQFAELERHLGHISVAVDAPPAAPKILSGISPEKLAGATFTLQPGVRYLQLSWPLDELMSVFLSGAFPDALEFAPSNVLLQVTGARGEFHMSRLSAPDFVFRKAIAEGLTLGAAAEYGDDAGAGFDPGPALLEMFNQQLVAGIAFETPGGE